MIVLVVTSVPTSFRKSKSEKFVKVCLHFGLFGHPVEVNSYLIETGIGR